MDGRKGFVQLVGEAGLGRVGLMLSRDVSRLSRGLADWGQLLEICGRTDTLIADAESVYDLVRHADRFLLGVLGTVSESELHTDACRARGQGGAETLKSSPTTGGANSTAVSTASRAGRPSCAGTRQPVSWSD